MSHVTKTYAKFEARLSNVHKAFKSNICQSKMEFKIFHFLKNGI